MESIYDTSMGNRLRTFRIRQKLSATSIARELRISVSTYREWENGRSIRGEPYVALAKVLRVSLVELLTGQKTKSSQLYNDFESLEEQFRKFKEALYSSF